VFDNAALKWEEVTGSWRKLDNEETHNLYQRKRGKMGGAYSIHGRGKKPIKNLSLKAK
jgi:hypothetical protein